MDNILDQLTGALPELPNKMLVAARFALDHPERIALASMRTVASECGVASPTMLRLARAMGYDSYEGFKSAFQREVIAEGFGDRASELRRTGETEAHNPLVARIDRSARTNIENSLSPSESVRVSEMAKALLAAETIYVLGAGSMHGIATFLESSGRMTLPGLRVPQPGDGSMIEWLSELSDRDAVLALAVSPYANSTIDALAFARERKAKILVITDKRSSPLLNTADHRLLAATTSPHYYPSFVAVVAVIEALLATVVIEGGAETLDRIALVESLREKSGAYVP